MKFLLLAVSLFTSASSFANTLDANSTAQIKALLGSCLQIDTSNVTCKSWDAQNHRDTLYGYKVAPKCQNLIHVGFKSTDGLGGETQVVTLNYAGTNVDFITTSNDGMDGDEYSLRVGPAKYQGVNDCVSGGLSVLKHIFR